VLEARWGPFAGFMRVNEFATPNASKFFPDGGIKVLKR
jgi:hypothetical protein